MKSIATALLIATLATAGTAALADENQSFESEFTGMTTYADLHRNDGVIQTGPVYPSSASETTSVASEFPALATYAEEHRNDPANQASSPWPSSANETTSRAEEGLYEGGNIGADAYAGVAQPPHN
jgi:hypothetical protein